MITLYRNKKGITILKKYCIGFDNKTEFHKIINKNIFYIHLLNFHFYYLK